MEMKDAIPHNLNDEDIQMEDCCGLDLEGGSLGPVSDFSKNLCLRTPKTHVSTISKSSKVSRVFRISNNSK